MEMANEVEPPGKEPPPGPVGKIIKRYSNRKLYDTDRSKYVTLDEIAEMIRAGDEVQVIDNKSKEDLTSTTLAQIIYEAEKRERKMPQHMLRGLIQSNVGALQEFFDRSVIQPVETVRGQAQERVEEIRQGAEKLRDVATKGVNDITGTARRVFSKKDADLPNIDSLFEKYESDFAGLFENIEKQIEDASTSSPPVVQAVVQRLGERLGELSAKLDRLHDACPDDGVELSEGAQQSEPASPQQKIPEADVTE